MENNMKNAINGMLIGLFVGVVDVAIFKLVMNFPENLIEAVGPISYWIIAGFLVNTSSLNLQPALKGIVIAMAMGIPWFIDYALNDKANQIGMLAAIFLVYGALTGFLCDKDFLKFNEKNAVELT